MRYLNKLVFINSATVPFAEVQLDGNVHFIGTQGVGKSTLLRAILFFYNGDTQKLGIGREKRPFAEYYFPYENSYIIYEVVRETVPYCVLAFKSQGKVCFRFIDSHFDHACFIDEQGKALERWENIRPRLDRNQIGFSRKIDRFEEYRDIIYGNTNAVTKDLQRYAILESKQYQNIPRTIQNVFLNSKLDADFIKQTIIMSLNEEEIKIDLENYSHHLKDFELQLNDIQKFQSVALQKQVVRIVDLHARLLGLRKDFARLAQQLVWAAAAAKDRLPQIDQQIETQTQEKRRNSAQWDEVERAHQATLQQLAAKIVGLGQKLERGKKLQVYYEKQNITQILQRLDAKASLDLNLKTLSNEKQLLTQQFGATEAKYDALLAELERSKTEELQRLQDNLLQLREEHLTRREATRHDLDAAMSELRKQAAASHEQWDTAVTAAREAVFQARLEFGQTRLKRFLEDELNNCEQTLTHLRQSLATHQHLLKAVKTHSEQARQLWDSDAQAARAIAEVEQKTLAQAEEQYAPLIADLELKLATAANTLYGWLNNHMAGWEDTLGKVINEEVLFTSGLSPRLVSENRSFFGVEIGYDSLPTAARTLAEYERDLQNLIARRDEVRLKIEDRQTYLKQLLDTLQEKYGSTILAANKQMRQLEYELQRDAQLLESEEQRRKELLNEAAQAQHLALEYCQNAMAQAETQLRQAEQQQRDDKGKQALRQQQRQQQAALAYKALDAEFAKEAAGIEEKRRVAEARAMEKRQALLARRNAELQDAGFDTARLKQLEEELQRLQFELEFIEKNRDLATEYRKDKRELLDHLHAFSGQLADLEEQKQQAEQSHQQRLTEHKQAQASLETSIQKQDYERNQLTADLAEYYDFTQTALWQRISTDLKRVHDSNKTEHRCQHLINQLNNRQGDLQQTTDEMKAAIHKFTGNFSANNIFKFQTLFASDDSFEHFADDLASFIANDKIKEFETRVNERFTALLALVGTETERLTKHEHEIQKVITSINSDFASKNFVTAIRHIELRIEPTANTIFRLLLDIKKFNEEHTYDLGGPVNLFSSAERDTNNRKAIDLLHQLTKVIAQNRADALDLADTFELRFRINENGNETPWVEKLSNVGSEGTDVLVKAMINIMLLNVFKETASKRFKDFRLHCMMDEIGKLHPVNVKGILQFANDRNIHLVNGSPTATNALDYKHIYRLERDAQGRTRIKRIVTVV